MNVGHIAAHRYIYMCTYTDSYTELCNYLHIHAYVGICIHTCRYFYTYTLMGITPLIGTDISTITNVDFKILLNFYFNRKKIVFLMFSWNITCNSWKI